MEVMQVKGSFFPWECHGKNLAIIRGINFTPREIDIIACLLHVRGTCKVSSLLSISPYTVSSHMRNIMLKLERNSREGIIDFIELSPLLFLLKGHYIDLNIYNVFKKGLYIVRKEREKKHTAPQPAHLILYGKQQAELKNFQHYLKTHLKDAGLHVSVENTNENDDFQEQTKEVHQNTKRLLLLDREGRLPQQLFNFEVLMIQDHRNYYFLVFEILKKFLPNLNIFMCFQDFLERDQGRSSALTETETKVDENGAKIKDKTFFFLIFIVFGICFFMLSFCYTIDRFIKNNNPPMKQTQDNASVTCIHSDFSLPLYPVLLERPDHMTQIDQKLNRKYDTEEEIQTIALIGAGGIGKTTLARLYAHYVKAKVIWEINAETKESLLSSFEQLAHLLAINEKDQKILIGFQEIKAFKEKEEKLVQFVKQRLKILSPWFLLYDNVESFETIQSYFPQNTRTWGTGKVMITTRNSHLQDNQYISAILPVKELTPLQKLTLFTKIMGNDPQDHLSAGQMKEVKEFLKKIPSFPLDISLAAYYLKATNISYEAYLKRLNKNNESFAKIQELIIKETGHYIKTRYGIIILPIEELVKNHRNFYPLLLLICLLDSQKIPRSLFDYYCQDELVIDSFFFALKKYSLIFYEKNSKNSFFSMHPHTQQICLAYLIKALKLNNN